METLTNDLIGGPGGTPSATPAAGSDGTTTNIVPVSGGDHNQSADDCTVRTGRETIAAEIKNLRKKVDTSAQLVKRIEVLEGVERDYPGTKKAYQDAYAQLARDDENLRDYFDSEKTKLKVKLGSAQAGKVEGLVNDRKYRTAELEQDVDRARAKLGRAATPSELYDQAIKDRTAELNAWKNLAATVTAQHAELKKAREDIIKARQEGRYGVAYGLLRIAQDKLDAWALKGPRLVKPEALHREFHFAAEDVAAAQQKLANAQSELDKDKSALAAANRYLEEHRKTSEAILLADLVDIEPPEDDATQQTGGVPPQAGGTNEEAGRMAAPVGGGNEEAGGTAAPAGGTTERGGAPESPDNDNNGQE